MEDITNNGTTAKEKNKAWMALIYTQKVVYETDMMAML